MCGGVRGEGAPSRCRLWRTSSSLCWRPSARRPWTSTSSSSSTRPRSTPTGWCVGWLAPPLATHPASPPCRASPPLTTVSPGHTPRATRPLYFACHRACLSVYKCFCNFRMIKEEYGHCYVYTLAHAAVCTCTSLHCTLSRYV